MLPLDHFTECASHRNCLREKKVKRKTRRDTQLSSTADWNCKVIFKNERGGERKRRSLACPSHSSGKSVYLSVAQRRWTKEALTGGWYIAKRLFTLMTLGPPLHHHSIHSFHPIHTAPAIPHASFSGPFIQPPRPPVPWLTLQLPAFAVEFPPLLSQVRAHANGVGRRLKPAKGVVKGQSSCIKAGQGFSF